VITGTVTEDGVPVIMLPVAGQLWQGIVDTGINGDLELPEGLRSLVNARFLGRMTSLLASGRHREEDLYLVEVPFDGQLVQAKATFVPGQEILIGIHLLRLYRLEISFPARTVLLALAPYGDAITLSDLNCPVNRYGGNNTSCYNWQLNADNRGANWYFER